MEFLGGLSATIRGTIRVARLGHHKEEPKKGNSNQAVGDWGEVPVA